MVCTLSNMPISFIEFFYIKILPILSRERNQIVFLDRQISNHASMNFQSKLNTERYVNMHYIYSSFYFVPLPSSMMKYDKHTLGKRCSKFLSKILWHFNQSPPMYLTVNRLRPSSMSKHVSNSHQHQQSSIDTNKDRIPYTKRYRTSSTRNRKLTLMSIQEENENELVNCK